MLLDILFPKHCLNCGKEGLYICQNCRLFLAEAEPLYFEDKQLDSLISLWQYEGIVKEAIKEIKKGTLSMLDELMRETEINLPITYIPMFIKKERRRGFNLAKVIAKRLREPVSLLSKIKDTVESLDYEERLDNVKDCFEAQDTDIKELILVDDFYVTGATMREAARVLREKGVEKIHGFVLARIT